MLKPLLMISAVALLAACSTPGTQQTMSADRQAYWMAQATPTLPRCADRQASASGILLPEATARCACAVQALIGGLSDQGAAILIAGLQGDQARVEALYASPGGAQSLQSDINAINPKLRACGVVAVDAAYVPAPNLTPCAGIPNCTPAPGLKTQ